MLIVSLSMLKVHDPPPVRLIDSDRYRASVAPRPIERFEKTPIPDTPPQETDLLASLTLSTKPVIRSNPIFGMPSLQQPPQTPIKVADDDDPDAMDWTPTNPSPKKTNSTIDYNEEVVVKPQHFFPPEQPTGLENLLSRTTLVEVSESAHNPSWTIRTTASEVKWYYWVCALGFVPVVAFVYYHLRIDTRMINSIYGIAGEETNVVDT
jgi:hypothetical protein